MTGRETFELSLAAAVGFMTALTGVLIALLLRYSPFSGACLKGRIEPDVYLERTLVGEEFSLWPVGVWCEWESNTGLSRNLEPGDWVLTWSIYGGFAVGLAASLLLIAGLFTAARA